jgi:hypothetical protein
MLEGGDGYAALGRGRTLVGATDGKLVAGEVMAYAKRISPIRLKTGDRIIMR